MIVFKLTLLPLGIPSSKSKYNLRLALISAGSLLKTSQIESVDIAMSYPLNSSICQEKAVSFILPGAQVPILKLGPYTGVPEVYSSISLKSRYTLLFVPSATNAT